MLYKIFLWILIKLRAPLEWPLRAWSKVGDHPVFETSRFPWAKLLEQHYRVMQDELTSIIDTIDHIPSFQQLAPEQYKLTKDDQWRTFFLMAYKSRYAPNIDRCPRTFDLLQHIPGLTTAFFSIFGPGKHLPPHRGPYAGVLRLHLALRVPDPYDQCGIRIHKHVIHWQTGKVVIFDDTYEHEAWNHTTGHRIVLFVDFERPLPWFLTILNRMVITLVRISPKVQRAKMRLKKWDKLK